VNGALNATSPAEKAPSAQAAVAPAASEPESIASGWLVDVPPGFKKIAEVRRQLPGKTAPVIQLAFSDGLAGISVFIEKAVADNDRRDGLLSQGVIQAYSRTIGDQLVTVIGELPPRTVMQIAQSVRERGE
jgi:sigma-E factor negative regulatory protein RseB